MKIFQKAIRWWGLILLGMAFFIRIIFALNPDIFERVYFFRFFPILRTLQAVAYPIWILPGYSIMFIALVLWLVFRLSSESRRRSFGRRTVNLVGFWISLFLVCFGYAYLDKGFAVRANLPPAPAEVAIVDVYFEAVKDAFDARKNIEGIPTDSSIVSLATMPSDQAISSWVRRELRQVGYHPDWQSSVRLIRPEGALRRLSISGIYNPFTGEANVDPALPNISMIFVKAHELAHAYGISSEAEANFIAYLACIRSGERMAEYAGAYAIWRQIAQEVNRTQDKAALSAIHDRIPMELLRDREAIRAAYFKHKAYFPELSESVNDGYLKLQGITDGTEDYDRFLQLYLAWKLTELP